MKKHPLRFWSNCGCAWT